MDHNRMKFWARIIWRRMGSDTVIKQQVMKTAWNFLTSKVTVTVEEWVHLPQSWLELSGVTVVMQYCNDL